MRNVFLSLLFLGVVMLGIMALDITRETISVPEFDKFEIQKYHNAAERAVEMRDIYIQMVARREGIDLTRYDYDILKGTFILKESDNEETTP